jgi:hypothetical protein
MAINAAFAVTEVCVSWIDRIFSPLVTLWGCALKGADRGDRDDAARSLTVQFGYNRE